MNKKMGRPRLPKGRAMGVQIGVRFKPDDDKTIENALSDDETTKADYIREAAIIKARNEPPWIRSKWTREQLEGMTVEYRLIYPKFRAEGVGKFLVRSKDQKLKIEISAVMESTLDRTVVHRYWLGKEIADKIERHPKQEIANFR